MSPKDQSRFPAVPSSVQDARYFTELQLSEYGCAGETVETAALLVSELATNAVRHARTSFDVAVEKSEETVEVAVIDTGPGQPVPRKPDASGGRGLSIVDALAQAWGVEQQGAGKCVFFLLPC
jgi:anti-sigma regulatory factor (Ser/Thr protein kinase)